MTHIKAILLAGAAIVGMSGCVNADSANGPRAIFNAPYESPYPADGVVIGQGWDQFTLSGSPGRCVHVLEAPIENSTYEAEVEEIKSRYSLSRKMGVSARVSGSFGGFSGGASADSSHSTSINSEYANMLFTFRSTNGSTQAIGIPKNAPEPVSEDTAGIIKNLAPDTQKAVVFDLLTSFPKRIGYRIALTEEARELIDKDPTLVSFRSVCGDGYVSAIHRGSELRVVATFKSASRSEQRTFRASVKGSGFGFKGSGSVEGSTAMSDFDLRTNFQTFQKGGNPLKFPTTFAEVKGISEQLGKLIDNPAAYRISVTPYSALPEYQLEAGKATNGLDGLRRMSNFYLMLSDLYDLLDGIYLEHLENPANRLYPEQRIEQYGGTAYLRHLRDRMKSHLAMFESTIQACFDSRTACTEKDAIALAKTSFQIAKNIEDKFSKVAAGNAGNETMASLGITDPAVAKLGADKLKVASQNIASLAQAKINAKQHVLRLLGDNDAILPRAFFEEFYNYLIQIPISIEALPLNETLTEQPTGDVRGKIVDKAQKAILVSRLLPWKQYFCNTAMSHELCVDDQFFEDLLNDTEYKKVFGSLTGFTLRQCRQITDTWYEQSCRQQCDDVDKLRPDDIDRPRGPRRHCYQVCRDEPRSRTRTECTDVPL